MADEEVEANLALIKASDDVLSALKANGIGEVQENDQKIHDLIRDELRRQEDADPDHASVYRNARRIHLSNVKDGAQDRAETRFSNMGGKATNRHHLCANFQQGVDEAGSSTLHIRNGFRMTDNEIMKAYVSDNTVTESQARYCHALQRLRKADARTKLIQVAEENKPAATRLVVDFLARVNEMQRILVDDLQFLHNPCPPIRFNLQSEPSDSPQEDVGESSNVAESSTTITAAKPFSGFLHRHGPAPTKASYLLGEQNADEGPGLSIKIRGSKRKITDLDDSPKKTASNDNNAPAKRTKFQMRFPVSQPNTWVGPSNAVYARRPLHWDQPWKCT